MAEAAILVFGTNEASGASVEILRKGFGFKNMSERCVEHELQGNALIRALFRKPSCCLTKCET